MELKAEGNALVGTDGDFRAVFVEISEGRWSFTLEREGIVLCRGRSLGRGTQRGVIRSAAKMVRRFRAMLPHLGTCAACSSATYPYNPAFDGKSMVHDQRWYEARAEASKAYFNRELPPFLVYRCLNQSCELHRQARPKG